MRTSAREPVAASIHGDRSRLLQTSHQITPDPLDHLLLVVKEVAMACSSGSRRMPCRINSKSAKLICRAAALDTSQFFLLFDVFARSRFNALT